MSKYQQRRVKAKISPYTMARELGISKEKYMEVDRGQRELEGELVDKFQDIIGRAKEIRLNRMQKMRDIYEWLDSKRALEDIKKMGYNATSLAKQLNISQPTISFLLSNKERVSDDLKEEVYDFLHNPMNKIISKPDKTIKKDDKKEEKQEVEEKQNVSEEPKEATVDGIKDVIKTIAEESKKEATESETDYKKKFIDCFENYLKLKEKNRKLERQVMLYEKLIERL